LILTIKKARTRLKLFLELKDFQIRTQEPGRTTQKGRNEMKDNKTSSVNTSGSLSPVQ
jgi:hypothetical protein